MATKKVPAKAAPKPAAKAAPAKSAASPPKAAAPPVKAVAAPTVTLKHLAAEVGERNGMAKKQADTVLAHVVESLVTHLKSGNRVRIGGLGILEVKKRAARMGRNPATGAGDRDQGEQEGRLPPRQGTQGSRLTPTISLATVPRQP